ncbi:hypothetical protein TruAng_002980 [Truncatella angustata]|nr:hypothetical protein TruAng_002980 [Truncatella angustata]
MEKRTTQAEQQQQQQQRKTRRTANAYLQDLQKQVEEQQQRPATVGSQHSNSPGASHPSAVQSVSQLYNASPTSPALNRDRQPPANFPQFETSFGSIFSQSSMRTSISQANSAKVRSSAATGLVSPESNIGLPARQQSVSGLVTSPIQPCDGTQHQHDILSCAFSVPSMVIQVPKPSHKRGWIWLAPWSTWSFTLRLMAMLREKLHPDDPSVPADLVSPNVYSWNWKTSANSDLPDIGGLPSEAHAIYLFNAVKFHLDQTYRLFDDEFEDQIHQFYANPLQTAGENRLWFVKFLLILAFGTAFHAPPLNGSSEPPGANLFKRAMTLIPDTSSLYKDSIIAIEVLALAAMYLYSADEREAAYIQLGQALRIAQLDGRPEDDHWGHFLSQTGSVISTGIKSAVKILEVFTSEYSLLEAFLPFDIEFTFAAALHLTMASTLFPQVINYAEYQQSSHLILDDLMMRGNRIASARRAELAHLEQLCQALTAQIQRQGHQTLHLQSQDMNILTTIVAERSTSGGVALHRGRAEENNLASIAPNASADRSSFGMALESGYPLSGEQNGTSITMDFLSDIGISSEEFNNIVQQIGDPETLPESMLTLG